jgi:hypothetical protein
MRHMKFAKPIPEGMYTAIFRGVEDTKHEDYGSGLRWRFEILDGDYAGREVTRITPVHPTPRNICGKLFRGVTGCDGDGDCDIDAFVGIRVQILVAPTQDGGGTRVDGVFPANKPAPQPAPPAKEATPESLF